MKNTRCVPTLGGVRSRSVPATKDTQRVGNHRIPSRPHLQGDPAPPRLRHNAHRLIDGGGLDSSRVLQPRFPLRSARPRLLEGRPPAASHPPSGLLGPPPRRRPLHQQGSTGGDQLPF